ncbi:MAG: pyridoxal 5'-phosphate synthase glutaminase subunit PdxT [Methanomassiliicoccales archaeon]|nr:pyridoxal 5'-phosphate synthase glutaminase subunit PdxT [Methanomassiliicoccales archaeon]
MRIGVISVQGAFPEHIRATERALANTGMKGTVQAVRRAEQLDQVDAIIIPGGESTTISRLLVRFGLHERIVRMAGEGVPILGTCAGLVLLAKEGDGQVEKTDTKLLDLMDMAVDRNAFGRQRESFEAELKIKGLDDPFPAIFIRAPLITRVWGRCEEMARYENCIVMARQENLMALSFHPELSSDTRIHEMLIRRVR